MKETQGKITMRPRARLINLIGEELISDEPVALVELVKNAYDADARSVQVIFEGIDPEKPQRIIVIDNGHGMDLETVLTSWFEPGTNAKRTLVHSPGGRPFQGAKGIGRFACARLAHSLLMESKTQAGGPAVLVLLEWSKFAVEGFLDEIELDYELTRIDDFGIGTRLTLEGLSKTWNEADYGELHSRLSRLISPFEDVKDFEIVLGVPANPELSGLVQPPELILQPKYMLKGMVDKLGYFNGELRVDGKKAAAYSKLKLGEAKSSPLCGTFQVEIRAWDRDREGLEPITASLGVTLQEVRRTLNTYCGVSIYRDGFRVYPYGQKGNDWLNLDLRSRLNPVRNMANNQIVGAIRISRDQNSALRDRSNREGMVLNAEHAALEEWFKEVLSLLEEKRYKLRPREKNERHAEPLFEAFEISGAVQTARKELGSSHPVTVLLEDTEKQVNEGVERVQEVFSRLLMSAGLGHMIDIVIHEIGSPLGKVNRQLALLEAKLKKVLQGETWTSVDSMMESMKGWLVQIHSLRQRLDPQIPGKRGSSTTFDVKQEIQDDLELYRALIERQKIEWKLEAPKEEVSVKMSRAALGQIVVNLIDNSIYWIVRSKGSGNGGNILLTLRPSKDGFELSVCDDGPGVAEEDRGNIFEPYFTRKPNGIGLGLYIARLVIEPYGKLIYREDGKLPGACFEAIFERRVGR